MAERRSPVQPGNPVGPRGPPRADASWTVPDDLDRKAVDAALRALSGSSWSAARAWVLTGKVRLDGEAVVQPTRHVRAGQTLSVHQAAPRPAVAQRKALESDLLVHVDAHVVVVDKPAGISTVPFEEQDPNERSATLDGVVREVLVAREARGRRGGGRRAPLGVVHRLDKPTTGLLVFARTVAAKQHLAQQARRHSMRRVYLAIAHGDVGAARLESWLVADRGDGIRGSACRGAREGQHAVTHVKPLERLDGATLVECRLETGRTHQIRIHLSEAGHPLVGETVYARRGAPRIAAPRLMLHAVELEFEHPGTEERVTFRREPPADFQAVLAGLRRPR